ncbi:MAG: Ig-like domain-containing protein [Syntrophomonadaceae bacterium]|nr:Ig-like domain-containing protein [Syntrophomonadaceae bacterium]
MITIGPGKLDSEVVTFKFTADMSGKAVDPTKVPGGPPTGISLDRNRIDLPVGGTYRLEATVTPFNATNQDLIWSSSDTRVATVDNRGLVTVVGLGTAVITVTTADGNHKAICVVNGPDEEQDEEAASLTSSTGPEPPEPAEQQLPQPQAGVNPVADSNTSTAAALPAESTIPEDRAQYLAKKEEIGSDPGQEAVAQQPTDNWRVFEMSADTIPLPLKVAEDRMKIYSTIMLLLFFLSGAGQKYAQFTKERL